jgi:acyl-CoA reductase-like NAD-dependent aldehyde dehydrogenase
MSEFTMTIDGKGVAGASQFGVVNPATGEVFTQAPECSKAQLDGAMEAAQRAFRAWRRDEEKRRQVLRDCASALKARMGELAKVLTQEQGKPLARATEEVFGAAIWLEVTAGLQIPIDVLQDNEQGRIEVRRKPYGVVGAITPWNFPLLLAIWKIAPALLAGNTVVLKPSPFTPLTTLKLGEILRDVVPAGVVNRFRRHRQEDLDRCGAGPKAGDPRARWERRRDRARGREPEAGGREALLGSLLQLGSDLFGHQAPLRTRGRLSADCR